jgi:hypothetical protein
MSDLMAQEARRLSCFAQFEQSKPHDSDDPQLHQQHPIVHYHIESAPSAADFDPIIKTLPVSGRMECCEN